MKVRLHTHIEERGGAPVALVLLHGFMGSHEDWLPLLGEVTFPGRILLVDLPGHGGSVHLPPLTYLLEGAREALAYTLAHYQAYRVILAGYSMGGRLALSLGLEYPERCAGLWLESTSPGLPDDRRVQRWKEDLARARRLRDDFEGFLQDWYRQPLFATLQEHPEVLAQLLERRRKQDPEELARALMGMTPACQPDYWPRLSECPVPPAYICGARDTRYAAIGQRLQAKRPDARVHIIPDVGHNVHTEAPEAYIAYLNAYLAERLHASDADRGA